MVDGYLQTLDKFMGLEGKLHQNFRPEEHFDEPKGALSFDKFYEALQNWGMAQRIISYDELAAVEKNPAFMAL